MRWHTVNYRERGSSISWRMDQVRDCLPIDVDGGSGVGV